MRGTILQALQLFSAQERRQLILLVAIMACAALIETLGIASILPYMALLTAPESPITKRIFTYASMVLGTDSREHILTFLGVFVFLSVVAGTTVSGLATWLSLRFAMLRTHSLCMRILNAYLIRDYSFFLQRNSSELLKNLLSEVSNVVGGVLTPLIQITTRLLVVILLAVLLIVVNPLVAIVSIGAFIASYLVIYSLSRHALSKMGIESVKANNARYRILAELFGGIREVKLWNKEPYYISTFSNASQRFADLNAKNQLVSLLPRYGIEVVAFGGMVLVTIYLAKAGGDFSTHIPLLALYAAAGYKLLPSLQQIYVNFASIRYSLASLGVLVEESKSWHTASDSAVRVGADSPRLKSLAIEIKFMGVTYQYAGSDHLALGPVDISIPAFATIGIIGQSGAGKSTLLDVLLGLLSPSSGEIRIDGEPLTSKTRTAWANQIGYVPQNIFLTDGSVAENIAFGTAVEDIDSVAVEQAAKAAQLFDLVQTLPGGFSTLIGERGIWFSGGQRQRIAIARALYRNPAILIFDEATSALDQETEEAVMDAVRALAHQKTIVIVTHRTSTLRDCDYLYVLEHGKVTREIRAAELSSISAFDNVAGGNKQ